jgi:hypothetical protein
MPALLSAQNTPFSIKGKEAMRSSFLAALVISSGVLSSSGCYMDGAWHAPTWNNMTGWWRNPKTEASPTAMAGGPSVQLPSSANPAPGTAAPGAPGAITASTQGGAATPAYDATKASYTNVSPNMYPNTGMASFNSPSGGGRANMASYDATPRGSNGYSTGGAYDSRTGQDYTQAGPYDSVYGGSSRPPANTQPGAGVTQNPYASPAAPATPAITDRSIAASAGQDRYGDHSAAASANANNYLPAQNDPRLAARNTGAASNPLVNPGTVRTRQEQPYQPGVTGYNPGQTGYQPAANVGMHHSLSGSAVPSNTAAASAYNTQATASPRRESTWSPGGTSRYPGANPAATTAANTMPAANTLPPANSLPQSAATRDPQPSAAYHDPSAPDAPARTADPSRYDDMR